MPTDIPAHPPFTGEPGAPPEHAPGESTPELAPETPDEAPQTTPFEPDGAPVESPQTH